MHNVPNGQQWACEVDNNIGSIHETQEKPLREGHVLAEDIVGPLLKGLLGAFVAAYALRGFQAEHEMSEHPSEERIGAVRDPASLSSHAEKVVSDPTLCRW